MSRRPRPAASRHDLSCAASIRARRLREAGDPAEPDVSLLQEIAVRICDCCGFTRLKAHRLAWDLTVTRAVEQFHAMCRRDGLKTRGLVARSWMEWEAGERP